MLDNYRHNAASRQNHYIVEKLCRVFSIWKHEDLINEDLFTTLNCHLILRHNIDNAFRVQWIKSLPFTKSKCQLEKRQYFWIHIFLFLSLNFNLYFSLLNTTSSVQLTNHFRHLNGAGERIFSFTLYVDRSSAKLLVKVVNELSKFAVMGDLWANLIIQFAFGITKTGE